MAHHSLGRRGNRVNRYPLQATLLGHITHAGNDRVRTILVESSWILIGKDPHMRYKYEDVKHRRGGKRTIVAVARNLSIRIRRMLLDHVPCEIDFQKAAYK